MYKYVQRIKNSEIPLMDEVELASRAIMEYIKDTYPELLLDFHDNEDEVVVDNINSIIRDSLE